MWTYANNKWATMYLCNYLPMLPNVQTFVSIYHESFFFFIPIYHES